MMTETEVKACESCGASIFPEHIHSGKAAVLDEKLLCPICLEEQRATSSTPLSAMEGEKGVSLVDEGEMERSGRKIIKAMGGVSTRHLDETTLQRGLQKTGSGATRVKIFHTKMNDGAIEFMVQNINEWIDHNPEVDIKIVQTTVGVWEGKHPEPHLILSVWY
ncbi:MAG: hypothetical protein WC975_10075 [Phycisphaerae bacterium]